MRSEIAAIVNLHHEGSAAIPSMISAWRAVQIAAAAGTNTELVLVLDQPDDATTRLGESWRARGASIITCDAGDLGAARNAAAEAVDAEWLAFLDGDDLWSENWLVRAHSAAATAGPSPMIDVWHPQLNVIFGDHHSLLHHVASTDQAFSWARFRLHNAWTALGMVRRTHLLSLPYPRNDLANGFGFEDWSWNAEVLRRGGRHHVVPDTCHFVRRLNNESLLSKSQTALRSPYSSSDLVGHLSPDRLPGRTITVSELTATDADLPPTHQRAKVHVSTEILEQIRIASTVEPQVLRTLHHQGQPQHLPQNFNTHVSPAQRALESIDLLAAERSFATAAELCDASELLAALDPADRASVVTDVLLDPRHQTKPRGTSALIDETLSRYPQLVNFTW